MVYSYHLHCKRVLNRLKMKIISVKTIEGWKHSVVTGHKVTSYTYKPGVTKKKSLTLFKAYVKQFK